jgi:hypothetical protein
MGWKISPFPGPVADQMAVLCGNCSREMSHPCIDPSNRIRDIGAVHGEFIPDKEILCDIFLHPFAKPEFLLNRPSTIPHLPYLRRGFLHGSCERKGCEEECEDSDQEPHGSILRILAKNCQQRETKYSKKLFLDK